MSNQYSRNHIWNQSQNQINFAPIQLEQEYDFASGNPRQQQQQQQNLGTQPAFGPDAYHYPQQQVPPNLGNNPAALHNAFAIPGDSQQQRSRTLPTQSNVNGGFIHGAYGSQQTPPSATMNNSGGYRTDSTTFNFTGAGTAMQGVDAGRATPSGFLNTSPLRDSFAQGSTRQSQNYYGVDDGQLPDSHPSKRPRGDIFNQEESEGDIGQDQKDANKSKLSRACARCKNLKVRCEAKTETEPCKRCFNGGHECVIPGRKIRRTPPKREHLLNQIQTQAAEIERLIHELEKVSASTASPQVQPRNQINTDSSNIYSSPVLTPSTATSGSYLTDPNSISVDGVGYGLGGGSNANNPVVNKAVEDWIAKARESLHEFGTFIGIGGAGMPRSYLVEDSDSSDDDEFVDVSEELDEGQFGNDDDRYEVAVQDPNGGGPMAYRENTPAQHLRHHSSNSSIGTAATGMTGVTAGTNTTTGTGTNAMPRPMKLGNESLARPANLPIQASPFGLFGNLSLKGGPKSRSGSVESEEDEKGGAGIANEDFFRSTPAPNALGRRLESAQHQAPAILTRGIISPQEAEKLFKIYFDNMNLSLSLLDPVLYTAQRTFYRSPFLFTVICAIASRFYSQRQDLYAKCMHYAQLAAGTALISGNKNVEMCSAYILLSLYPVPSRKWEDQRGWLYLGLAIRTATDLNLHLPTTAKPLNENHAREMLNRTRVWMNCLNLDRSTGSQYGKPPIISSSDYISNHSQNWWNESDYNMKNFDIHICGYNSELKVMSAFVAKIYSNPDSPTGLNKDVDFERIATETDDQLKNLWEVWSSKLEKTDMTDPQNAFRTGLLKLAYNYSRLVALSYGFQHAFGKNNVDENPFLMRCLAAAFDVVDVVVHEVCTPSQIHFFRHGPEAQSVFVTFASAFLVKLLQPRFAGYLDMITRAEIRNRVQSVIDLLRSPEVAIDNRHGPKLYSRFLEKLLAKPMARLDPMSPGSASNIALPRHNSRPPRTSTMNTPEPTANAFELPPYNNPSPTTTNSLSPPPTESALSFDSFAPTQFGAADPFAPETMAVNAQSNNGNMMSGQFFSPPLPFDDHILQSLQSLTEPSGWQDINLPGFNWMSQFQQNLGMDLNNGNVVYDQNMEYLTGLPNDS